MAGPSSPHHLPSPPRPPAFPRLRHSGPHSHRRPPAGLQWDQVLRGPASLVLTLPGGVWLVSQEEKAGVRLVGGWWAGSALEGKGPKAVM